MTKTYRSIENKFTKPGMRDEIQEFIRGCQSCQEQKLVRAKTREPMIITDTHLESFDKVSLCTAGPLSKTSNRNKHILIMQVNLTKYCMAVPISNIRAATVADAVAKHLIAQYGSPKVILSDRGGFFISTLMTLYLQTDGFCSILQELGRTRT